MSYRSYRSVRYRYWYSTETTGVSGIRIKLCTGTDSTCTHVPNFPKCPVPVLTSYWTYRSSMDVVPIFPRCPAPLWKSVPVSMSYGTYRSVRYRYWRRTELSEVSDTSMEVVPNLPKCPVAALSAVRINGMTRYVPKKPFFVCFSEGTLQTKNWSKIRKKHKRSPLELKGDM